MKSRLAAGTLEKSATEPAAESWVRAWPSDFHPLVTALPLRLWQSVRGFQNLPADERSTGCRRRRPGRVREREEVVGGASLNPSKFASTVAPIYAQSWAGVRLVMDLRLLKCEYSANWRPVQGRPTSPSQVRTMECFHRRFMAGKSQIGQAVWLAGGKLFLLITQQTLPCRSPMRHGRGAGGSSGAVRGPMTTGDTTAQAGVAQLNVALDSFELTAVAMNLVGSNTPSAPIARTEATAVAEPARSWKTAGVVRPVVGHRRLAAAGTAEIPVLASGSRGPRARRRRTAAVLHVTLLPIRLREARAARYLILAEFLQGFRLPRKFGAFQRVG